MVIFRCYVSLLEGIGGLQAIQRERKAELIYFQQMTLILLADQAT